MRAFFACVLAGCVVLGGRAEAQQQVTFDELSPLVATGRIDAPVTTIDLGIDRLLLPPLNSYLAPALGYDKTIGAEAKLQAHVIPDYRNRLLLEDVKAQFP